MKHLLIASILALSAFQASAEEQGAIPTIRELRNEAKDIIKDFELTDLNIEAGAPEYREIRNLMHTNIKSEIAALDAHLDGLNEKLSTDYSLIVALKEQNNDAAVRRTIEVATQRLESKAKELAGAYHDRLRSLILLSGYQSPLMKKCLTVLCLEKVNLDFQNWFKKAKHLNKSLDLEVTEMKKIKKFSKVLKNEKYHLEHHKNEAGKYLPVAITIEQYEDHLKAEQAKIEEAARIAREKEEAAARAQRANEEHRRQEEERLREEEAVRRAKAEELRRREGQPYGCEKLEEIKANEIYRCVNPYKLINNTKAQISDLAHTVYSDICAAHGLKVPTLRFPWSTDASTEIFSGYFFTSVTCEDDAFDAFSRYSYQSALLTDGSLVLSNFKVAMDRGYFGFLKDENDAKFVCRSLGYRSASDLKSTYSRNRFTYLTLNGSGSFSQETSGWNAYWVTSFKCLK